MEAYHKCNALVTSFPVQWLLNIFAFPSMISFYISKKRPHICVMLVKNSQATLRIGKILGTTSVVSIIEHLQDVVRRKP